MMTRHWKTIAVLSSLGLALGSQAQATVYPIEVTLGGLCTAPLANVGNECAVSSDCDVVPGDGACNLDVFTSIIFDCTVPNAKSPNTYSQCVGHETETAYRHPNTTISQGPGTGTLELDLATGVIEGGSYSINGLATAFTDVGFFLGFPDTFITATTTTYFPGDTWRSGSCTNNDMGWCTAPGANVGNACEEDANCDTVIGDDDGVCNLGDSCTVNTDCDSAGGMGDGVCTPITASTLANPLIFDANTPPNPAFTNSDVDNLVTADGDWDVGTDTITIVDHDRLTADGGFQFRNEGGALPTPITARSCEAPPINLGNECIVSSDCNNVGSDGDCGNTFYFVVKVDDDHIRLVTLANADSGVCDTGMLLCTAPPANVGNPCTVDEDCATVVDITAASGGGTHTMSGRACEGFAALCDSELIGDVYAGTPLSASVNSKFTFLVDSFAATFPNDGVATQTYKALSSSDVDTVLETVDWQGAPGAPADELGTGDGPFVLEAMGICSAPPVNAGHLCNVNADCDDAMPNGVCDPGALMGGVPTLTCSDATDKEGNICTVNSNCDELGGDGLCTEAQFYVNGNSPVTLHRTQADAIANTNPVNITSTGSGMQLFLGVLAAPPPFPPSLATPRLRGGLLVGTATELGVVIKAVPEPGQIPMLVSGVLLLVGIEWRRRVKTD